MEPFLEQLQWQAPARLIMLAVVPALVYVAWRSTIAQPTWQRVAAAFVRGMLVAVLCLAWAGPSIRQPHRDRMAVFVADQSASTDGSRTQIDPFLNEAFEHRGRNAAALIRFAAAPGHLKFEPGVTDAQYNAAGTNIEDALLLAQAAVGPEFAGNVVLLSDGLETAGNALSAAAVSRWPVSVVSLGAFSHPEAAVTRVETPAHAAAHIDATIQVHIVSNRPQQCGVRLLQGQRELSSETIDLPAGESVYRATARFDGDRPASIVQAVIEPQQDALPENNSLASVIVHQPRRRILLVDANRETTGDFQTLLAEMKFDVSLIQPSQLPGSAADANQGGTLDEFDLVILSDVSAARLSPKQLQALDDYVHGGGGLMAIGGEKAFGVEAFQLTRLEKMLPLAAVQQDIPQQKSLAMVLVIDKSLSMREERRLDLAKDAAKKVADVLQAQDQVGVLAFGDQSQWVSPLAPLSDRQKLIERIDALTPLGLTNMYPALERAYLSLLQTDADSRHVIVLTDGVPTPGDFPQVAEKMAAAGITVSTVSLSKGADQTILKDISRIAGGNHYHADDPKDLPRILERETRTAVSKVESPQFKPIVHRRLPGLDVASAPPLLGYATTRAKAAAQILLLAGEGDPLLAWWRYGRGVAVAFTSDVNDETGRIWKSWNGRKPFWRRLVLHALPQKAEPPGNVHARYVGEQIVVSIDALDLADSGDVRFVNNDHCHITGQPLNRESGASETSIEFTLPQVAPGKYQGSWKPNRSQPYLLRARISDGQRVVFDDTFGIAPTYADEFRPQVANGRLLQDIAAITGGTVTGGKERENVRPSEVFANDDRIQYRWSPVWPHLLVAVLLLFIIDVAIRRFPFNESRFAR